MQCSLVQAKLNAYALISNNKKFYQEQYLRRKSHLSTINHKPTTLLLFIVTFDIL